MFHLDSFCHNPPPKTKKVKNQSNFTVQKRVMAGKKIKKKKKTV